MIILRDLKQASRYQIAVTAFTSKGEGRRSSWYLITTGNAFFVDDTDCYVFSFRVSILSNSISFNYGIDQIIYE